MACRVSRFLGIPLVCFLAAGLWGCGDSTTPEETVSESIERDSRQTIINERFQDVIPIMEYSCFDCHSRSTDYPWYHAIPGIGAFMDGHIEEAREHLDMSNGFPFKGYDSQAEALEEIREEIEEGEMPILSYRIMHWGRMVEGAKRDSVFAWIDASLLLLRSHAPDSDE